MKDRDIKLMYEICEKMGIEWDDEAEGIEVNGKPIEKSMIDNLFSADNPYVVFGRCNDKPEPCANVEECKKRLNEMGIKIGNIESLGGY